MWVSRAYARRIPDDERSEEERGLVVRRSRKDRHLVFVFRAGRPEGEARNL